MEIHNTPRMSTGTWRDREMLRLWLRCIEFLRWWICANDSEGMMITIIESNVTFKSFRIQRTYQNVIWGSKLRGSSLSGCSFIAKESWSLAGSVELHARFLLRFTFPSKYETSESPFFIQLCMSICFSKPIMYSFISPLFLLSNFPLFCSASHSLLEDDAEEDTSTSWMMIMITDRVISWCDPLFYSPPEVADRFWSTLHKKPNT